MKQLMIIALMMCSVFTSCADKEELNNEVTKTIAGNYNVSQSFTFQGVVINFNFSSLISIGTDPKKITIGNFAGSGEDITADLENTTSLKITNQTVGINSGSSSQFLVNGTGSINGTTITLNYTYTASTTGDVYFIKDVYTKI
jgi:hypothetical protein